MIVIGSDVLALIFLYEMKRIRPYQQASKTRKNEKRTTMREKEHNREMNIRSLTEPKHVYIDQMFDFMCACTFTLFCATLFNKIPINFFTVFIPTL